MSPCRTESVQNGVKKRLTLTAEVDNGAGKLLLFETYSFSVLYT